MIAALAAVILVVGLFPTRVVGATDSSDDPERLIAREVKAWDAKDFGASRPVGIAYDSSREQFVVAATGTAGVIVTRVSPTWDRLGGAVLPDVTNPSTLVYDAAAGAFRSVDGESLTSVDGSRVSGRIAGERIPLRGTDLTVPSSATYEHDSGSMVVVDLGAAHIVDESGYVESVALSELDEGDLVAHNPEDGLLYVLRSDSHRLNAVDSDGETVATYDTAELEMESPEAMTFAPSTDSTDDPNSHNLFVANSGDDISTGLVMEATLEQSPLLTTQSVEQATLIQSVAAHMWSPPSTDPSGITWNPNTGRLIVVDSEVNETQWWEGVNMWHISRSGSVLASGTTDDGSGNYSSEPTGVGYDPHSNTLFISDDSGNKGRPVHVVKPGPDGVLGTHDDQSTQIRMADQPMGSTDTEDSVFDPVTGHLFVLTGVDREIHRMAPVDGDFSNGATFVTSVELSHLGPTDFEGLTMSPSKETLFVGARTTGQIFEITRSGELLRTIEVDVGESFISGLALAPSSSNSSVASLWIADRRVDEQRDGMLFEIDVSNLGSPVRTNEEPSVDAGPDRTLVWPDAATLSGSASDDGLPDGQLTVTWSRDTGPGTATFADPNTAQTTATFSQPGIYVLRLTADDGDLSSSDTMTVTVQQPEDPPDDDPPPDDPPDEDPPSDDPPSDEPTQPEVKAGTDWFIDDDGHLFEDDINAIATAGITRGCNPPENTMYCPEDTVTRGQMAAFLVRALNLTDDGGGDRFVDNDGHIFEGDIDRLATAGVTRGCNPPANDRFCPDDELTRGQMAAFLVRALGYPDDGGGDLFVDDDDSAFEGDIDRLATAGVTRGCNPPTNDRFCPDDPLSRGQMAAFLARALLHGG